MDGTQRVVKTRSACHACSTRRHQTHPASRQASTGANGPWQTRALPQRSRRSVHRRDPPGTSCWSGQRDNYGWPRRNFRRSGILERRLGMYRRRRTCPGSRICYLCRKTRPDSRRPSYNSSPTFHRLRPSAGALPTTPVRSASWNSSTPNGGWKQSRCDTKPATIDFDTRPALLTILKCGYVARCGAARCSSRGVLILRKSERMEDQSGRSSGGKGEFESDGKWRLKHRNSRHC